MGDASPRDGRFLLGSGLSASVESRPLKTGKRVTLVLHAPLVRQLAWDKAQYLEGDACTLLLEGSHLGKQPLTFIIEAQDGARWVERAKVEASPDAAEAHVKAQWKVPLAPPPPADEVTRGPGSSGLEVQPEQQPPEPPPVRPGRLSQCKFEDGLELDADKTAWVAARCEGLDGQSVEFVLEREGEGGWAEVRRAVSTVKGGQAHAGIPLDG